ncbi:hypothetical protein [Caballeronia sp. S22]|uniref:hypothetical protein n=1 Tax=Caballeronia sp. S22 TaxID=3137182 RepID=UPI003530ABD0
MTSSAAEEVKKYTPASTALDALIPLFFSKERTFAQQLQQPLHPAAAVVLCLLGNEDDMPSMSIELRLRFAFDREEARRIREVGCEKLVSKGLAKFRETEEAGTVISLTDAGKQIHEYLKSVFKDG